MKRSTTHKVVEAVTPMLVSMIFMVTTAIGCFLLGIYGMIPMREYSLYAGIVIAVGLTELPLYALYESVFRCEGHCAVEAAYESFRRLAEARDTAYVALSRVATAFGTVLW